VERIVASKFVRHAEDSNMHRTAEAIQLRQRVQRAVDNKLVTALVLLDSAFDTVDHSTLLTVLGRR